MYKYWRASSNINGSVWKDDPKIPASRVIKITFSFVNFQKGWIEFKNPTNADVDISGWAIQDQWTVSDKHEYIIPSKTIIPMGKILRVKTDMNIQSSGHLIVFQYDSTYKGYTGEYIEFIASEYEMAFK